MVVLPEPTAVPRPLLFIDTTPRAVELHTTVDVASCAPPFVYVPVAVNCWLFPIGIDALAGVTTIDTNAGALTVSTDEPVTAPRVALIVALPCPTLVAS